MESDPESVSGTGALPKVNQFFQLVGPITTPSFNEIGSLFFSNPAHRMTHRQTDRNNNHNYE